MNYIYNGKIFTDEEILSEYIFNELGKHCHYPTEAMIESEFESNCDEVNTPIEQLIEWGYEVYK